MSHLVRWLPQAIQDVQSAYKFLATKDIEAAKAAAEAILRQTHILENFPNAGRPTDDLDPEQRELLIPFGASGYVLVYEISEETVIVLAVKHQKESGY